MLDIDEINEMFSKKYYSFLSKAARESVESAIEEDEFWEPWIFLQEAYDENIYIDSDSLAKLRASVSTAFPINRQEHVLKWIAKHEERNATLAKQ